MHQQSTQDYTVLVESLLGDLNLIYLGQGEWRASCPFPHQTPSKSIHHFRVRDYGKRWNCFSCGRWGYIEWLVRDLLHLDLAQARLYIESAPRRRLDVSDLRLPLRRSMLRPQEKTYLKESSIAAYKTLCPQSLLARGFSQEVLRQYEVGYDNVSAKAVFPIRDHKGGLVGLTYRVDYDWIPEEAKYWHDFPDKASYLYGLHLLAGKKVKELWLVEGNLDPLRLWQLGVASAAIMGSSCSNTQMELLSTIKFDILVGGFDADSAGQRCTSAFVGSCIRRGYGRNLRVAVLPSHKKDPGELETLDGVELLSWQEWQTLYARRLAAEGQKG